MASLAAECGLELLRADRTDELARNLVAGGVAAKRYAAIELTIGRAFALRTHFPADFERMPTADLFREIGRWEGETGAELDALFKRQPGNRQVPDLK